MKRKAKHFKGKPVNKTLYDTCRSIDRLAAFDDLKEHIDAELLQDLRKGYNATQLREKHQAKIAAREITIALKGAPEKALTAIKNITDRIEGKPKEQKEIHHRLEKLNDDQLNAMLLTELEELQIKKN